MSGKEEFCVKGVYETPTCTDTLVILSFFQFSDTVRPLQNFLLVREHLRRAGIPTLVVEGVLAGREATLADSDIVVPLAMHCFQKEALWSIGWRAAPAHYTKFLFMDADVVWERTDFLDAVSSVLEGVDFCQPFEKVDYLDAEFRPYFEKISCAGVYLSGELEKTLDFGQTAPGLAWAVQRSVLERWGGFFSDCVVGSSDALLWHALLGKQPRRADFWLARLGCLRGWESFRDRVAGTRIGVVPGIITHLFHGPRDSRGYHERHRLVEQGDLAEIRQRKDGVWECGARLAARLAEHFARRSEDSVRVEAKPPAAAAEGMARFLEKYPGLRG